MIKKLICTVVFTVLMCYSCTVAFANSGPVFWQGYPSADVMAIKEDTPIRVDSEKLVFDFSESESDKSFSYGISGRVTATYQMVNPTAELQSVPMAFPLVGSMDKLMNKDIVISVDDRELEYKIYIGEVVHSYGSGSTSTWQDERKADFDFANIVSSITDKSYQAKNFSEDEKGKLYTIEVKPNGDQRINFAVDFELDHEKTNVYTSGLFSRYERSNQETRIAAWCNEPQTLEIFVLGEDLDLDFNAYTDGTLEEKTNLYTYEVSTQEVEVRAYLLEHVKTNISAQKDGLISDTQLYNLYAKALDENFDMNKGYSSEHYILEQNYYERILSLVYSVDILSNSEKEVSVSYRTSGTMDMTKTAQPLHSFDYILNPAKSWSSFKNIDIEIIPSPEAPYMVSSNIEFIQGEDKVYSANLAELPQDDLSFTLHANESITTLTIFDKIFGNRHGFGYLIFIPLLASAVGLIVLNKKKNKK